MDLRESPATLQSQPPHPPPGMAVGPPNSYLPNTTTNTANTTNNTANTANNNHHTHNPSSAMMQNPGFPFNNSASKPMDSMNLQYGDGSRAYGFTIEPARKKRGRPRKYSPDGGNIALGLTTTPSLNPGPSTTPLSSSMVVHGDSNSNSTPGTTTTSSEPQAKKSRGRPAGSGKKQLDALGSFGVGFTPHVILVEAGEDIASKIMAFSEQGPRTVCILSANGAVCNVALRQPAISGGIVTYEGRFEIISLSGSFSMSESNGARSRVGCLSVSLAGSDGRVLGGAVSGMLVAATPVQVIVGSFIADGKKKPKSQQSPAQPQPSSNMLNFGTPTTAAAAAAASPPSSQVPSSESSDDHENDDNNGNCSFDGGVSGPFNNVSQQPFHSGSMPMFTNMGWANPSVHMFPK